MPGLLRAVLDRGPNNKLIRKAELWQLFCKVVPLGLEIISRFYLLKARTQVLSQFKFRCLMTDVQTRDMSVLQF